MSTFWGDRRRRRGLDYLLRRVDIADAADDKGRVQFSESMWAERIAEVKRRWVVRGLLSAALVLLLCAIGLDQAVHWLDPVSLTQRTDAIVVLGGELPLRVGRGAALYKAGLAPELWITGDSPSPQALALVARQQGVPGEAIHILPTTSTWDDGRETAALAKRRGLHSILIVTSWYHHRRALCVLKQQLANSGIQVYHDSVPSLLYDRQTWWRHPGGWLNVFRELAAIAFYAVRHGLVVWNCE